MFASAQTSPGFAANMNVTILLQGCGLPHRQFRHRIKETVMSIGTIVLIILVLALLGTIPAWPHSRSWGYGPSGGIGLIVVILLILLLLGRI